jgi:hypothetical protein
MKRLVVISLLASFAFAQSSKKIGITGVVISQSEDGNKVPEGTVFISGETIYLSALLNGFATQGEDRPELRLSWEADALDPEGVAIIEQKKANVLAVLTPQDKDWLPKLRHEITIPPGADSGTYKLVLRVKDNINSTTASVELAIAVKGYAVEPSKELTVRNFRFFRAENDGNALTTPAYRPGDPVWGRFDMTGYKLGEKNKFDIAYGLEVFRPNGESIYKEPAAAELSETSFYRKRYMSGTLNLNPSADIAKGEYTIVLRVTDRLGNQQSETKHTFRIE